MRRAIYCLEAAWENICSQKVMTLISALTVSISLSLPGFFLLLYENLDDFFVHLRGNIQLMVYLDDRATGAETAAIKEKLLLERGVTGVGFTSKEKAREEFRKMGFDSQLFDRLEENPLPASFAVELRSDVQEDERYLSGLADKWRKIKGVEEVRYGSEWLSFLNRFLAKFRAAGALIGMVLAGTVVVIIAATIRLNYYARQGEMEILRLIGASRAFIRVPYLLEGSFLGGVASAVSMTILWALFRYLERNFQSGWMGLTLPLHFFSSSTVVFFLLAGGGLGAVGSLISLAFADHERA
jgi:cell division transport system permease protein